MKQSLPTVLTLNEAIVAQPVFVLLHISSICVPLPRYGSLSSSLALCRESIVSSAAQRLSISGLAS